MDIKDKMSPQGKEVATMYELLQRTRMELRHQAHIYSGNKKKSKFDRDRAGEALERAAITMALAAAQWGVHAGCARPAGAEGAAWEERNEPENLLRVWQEGLPAEAAQKAAAEIVDGALARSKRKR